MALTSGQVSIRITLTGDNRASATIKAAGTDLKQLEASATRSGSAIARAMSAGSQSFAGFKTAAGAALGKLGLVAAGVRTVTDAFSSVGEWVKSGAMLSDQMRILEKDVAGLGATMDKVRKSSAGMISDKEIVKSAAMFKSFGIPLDEIDRALEAVAKTALRTGQDVGFLTQSLTTGLARESPQILDNLGLQIRLSEATARATQTTGKFSSELTAAEKKAGLMAVALEKLEASNVNVDLLNSQTASVQRLGNAWENFGDQFKAGFSRVAVGALEELGVVETQLNAMERALQQTTGETLRAAGPIETLASAYGSYLEIAAGPALLAVKALGEAVFGGTTFAENLNAIVNASTADLFSLEAQTTRSAAAMDAFAASLHRTATEGEKSRAGAAVRKAQEDAVVESLERQRKLLAVLNRTDEEKAARVMRGINVVSEMERAYSQLLKEQLDIREELATVAEAATQDVAYQIRFEERAADAATEALDVQLLQIDAQELSLRHLAGISDLQVRIKAIEAEKAKLSRDNVADAKRLVDLNRELLGLLNGQMIVESAKQMKPRSGGGGRRKRAETLGTEDESKLLELQLRLKGELTDEDRKRLAHLDSALRLEALAEDRAKKRIDSEVFFNRIAQERLTLFYEISRIQEESVRREERLFELGEKELDQAVAARTAAREALGLGPTEGERKRGAISAAAGAGYVSGEEEQRLSLGADADENAAAIAAAYDMIADAAQRAAASQDEALAAFGRMAGAVGESGQEIADTVALLSGAFEKRSKAQAAAINSAVSVSSRLTAAVIADQQAQAIIMGLIETAASAASFATSDYAGGAMHAIAAALYFAAAGDSSAGKKASSGGGASAGMRRTTAQAPPGGADRGARTVININSPAAVIGGTPQEVATQLDVISRSNAGTGFDGKAA